MRCERFEIGDDPARAAAAIRALVPPPATISAAVAAILDEVRERGDQAVRDFTARFDTGGGEVRALRVDEGELDSALERLDPAVRDGLELSIRNVRAVSAAALGAPAREVQLDDQVVMLRREPLGRAAVYVPGGRAPYPSTVVMGVVPARVAGVDEVVVCSPPGKDGEINGVVLGACRLAGASEVYRMGGAQAIGALAYGTESVAGVDVIAGPGNLWVQEAKRQVCGLVAIDGFAGPSDLLVLADADQDAEEVALDLLAQAEHGPGTLVVGVLGDERLLAAVQRRLEAVEESGAVVRLAGPVPAKQALEFAQAFAPEHLELIGAQAEELAPAITRAGCVFVGAAAGTAFGDYIAGSNHVLPTDGAARFASALSVEQFCRRFTEVHIKEPSRLARAAVPVARAEGFEWHARSMEARIRDNQSDGSRCTD